jgi:hypothetical protein
MRHFPQKQQLFDLTLCKHWDVLSWKMIARHHYEVHRTGGIRRHFQAFYRSYFFGRTDSPTSSRRR